MREEFPVSASRCLITGLFVDTICLLFDCKMIVCRETIDDKSEISLFLHTMLIIVRKPSIWGLAVFPGHYNWQDFLSFLTQKCASDDLQQKTKSDAETSQSPYYSKPSSSHETIHQLHVHSLPTPVIISHPKPVARLMRGRMGKEISKSVI